MLKSQGVYSLGQQTEDYIPGLGCFSLAKQTPEGAERQWRWFGCREEFADLWKQTLKERPNEREDILMVVDPEQQERIQTFLKETEKRLKLKKFTSICTFSNYNRYIIVKIGPWWKKNELRRQFLTALLRNARNYDANLKNSIIDSYVLDQTLPLYERTLYSHFYFYNSKDAVEKFLNGYTYFSKPNNLTGRVGWFFTFNTNQNLDKLMTRAEFDKLNEN